MPKTAARKIFYSNFSTILHERQRFRRNGRRITQIKRDALLRYRYFSVPLTSWCSAHRADQKISRTIPCRGHRGPHDSAGGRPITRGRQNSIIIPPRDCRPPVGRSSAPRGRRASIYRSLMNTAPRLSDSPAEPVMPMRSKKRAHKKRRAELKKQARAPGTQKGYLCCSERTGSGNFS